MAENKKSSNNNSNNFSKFIKYKVNSFNVDLDEIELFEETKTSIKVVYYDNNTNDFKMLNIKEFFVLYSKHNKDFKDFLNTNYYEEKMDKKISAFILDFKTNKPIYKFIRYSLDLTADNPYIKTKDNTIILTYNSLAMPQNLKELQKVLNIVNVANIDLKEYKHYIKTFTKEHFEELNDLLQFITIFLFYTDKKSSFLNLISPSNFGKTDFFIRLLTKRLNIAVETEHKILEYTPSPLSYNDFLRKGTFLIDEFKVFRQEFKTMTDQLTLNPKGEKQIEVELFSKLFFSKEKSKSFKGVVDSQIINRVLLIDKSKTKRTIPQFLQKHPEIDAEKLKDYLTIYYWRYFNKYINYYRKLNFKTRQKILEEKLNTLKEKYRIKNVKTTEEYITETFYTHLFNVIEKMKEFKTNEITLTIENDTHDFKLENNNIIYISKFETFLKNILKAENEDYYNNVKHTIGNEGIIDIINTKPIRINGKLVKTAVIKFDLNKLKEIAEELGTEFIDLKEQKLLELQAKLQNLQQTLLQKEKLLDEITNKYNELEKKYNELKKEKEAGETSLNNNYNNNNIKSYQEWQEEQRSKYDNLPDDDFPF